MLINLFMLPHPSSILCAVLRDGPKVYRKKLIFPNTEERSSHCKNRVRGVMNPMVQAKVQDSSTPTKKKVEEVSPRELESLRKTLKEAQGKADEYLNRLKYLQADFENYQKRIRKEMDDLARQGSERVVTKLIGIIDDLERAVKVGRETEDKKGLLEGVEMVSNQLFQILQQEGLSRIEAVGKPFDPNQHEAVSHVETCDYPDNIVINELRRGYMLNGKVVRPSMVEVAKNVTSSKV